MNKRIWNKSSLCAILFLTIVSISRPVLAKSSLANDAFGKAVSKMASQYERQGYGAQALDPYGSARLIVKGKSKNLNFDKYGAVDAIKSSSNVYLVQFSTSQDAKAAAQELKKTKAVVYVEPDAYMGTSASINTASVTEKASSKFKSWGVEHVNADKYASYLSKKSSKSVTVAVVDSGVSSHSLIGKKLLAGYDFVDGDGDAADEYFHGTHVAGIIAECTKGLNVKILPVRVLGKTGGGDESVIGVGITYAADHGADVINLSLGGKHSEYIDDCITYAIKKGAVVCVSAGNQCGKDTADVCPAHLSKAVVVGAVNSLDQLAEFSNIGSSVDIVAPGVDIVSSVLKGKYRSVDGTSQAAPYVAAAAAMLRLAYPSYSPAQIEKLLKQNTIDLGTKGKDKLYGAGVLYLKVPEETEQTVQPETISLSKSKLSMKVGETAILTQEVSPVYASNKTVKWSSSKKDVLAVTGGILKAKKAGSATITATASNGMKATCKVTVSKSSASSTYTKIPEVDYNASNASQAKKAVKLKTGTNRLEGTSGYLKFTAPQTGTYEFTFSVDRGKELKSSIKAEVSGRVYVYEMNKSKYFESLGENTVETQGGYLSYSPLYLCDSKSKKANAFGDMLWRNIPNRYARLEIKKGKTIYFDLEMATYKKGTTTPAYSAKLKLTVKKKKPANPTAITLDQTEYSLKTGETLQLKASVSPVNAINKELTWVSDHEEVASVSDGLVTAQGAGSAVISASTANGKKASCKITVTASVSDYTEFTKIPSCDYFAEPVIIRQLAVNLTAGQNRLATGSEGFLVFTAPDDGTYEFTFKALNGDEAYNRSEYDLPIRGYVTLHKIEKHDDQEYLVFLEDKDVATQGGRSSFLYFCDEKYKSEFSDLNSYNDNPTQWYIPERYARVKLQEGESLYFDVSLKWDNYFAEGHTTLPPKMEVVVAKK